MSRGSLFIISAPSGAGKTTLAKRLVVETPLTVLSVSHTTRPRRPGETDGVDYFFIDRGQFEAMAARCEFLEYAEVFGNLYGTARKSTDEQLDRGHNVLLDIDWQGARKVRERNSDARSIFVLPPSKQELERRLRSRGQDSDAVIEHRMQEAAEEMSHYAEYDFVVINDELESALADLKNIVSGQPGHVRRITIDIAALVAEAG